MKLKNINTSRFLYDPSSKYFLDEINKIPEFKEFESKYKQEICTWICLVWDLNTPLGKEYSSYLMLKYVAAEIAGFKKKKNGRFTEEFEDILVGVNEGVAKLIAAFLAKFSPQYAQLKAFLALQQNITENINKGEFDSQTAKNLDFIAQKIVELTNLIFGSGTIDEIAEMRNALYAKAEFDRLSDKYRPEAIVHYHSEHGKLPDEFDQYGEGLEPVVLKFVGDGN